MSMAQSLETSKNDQDQITDAEFWSLSKLVYNNFGIVLGEEKRSLVIGRLTSCLSRRGLKSFSEYLKLLKNDANGEIHSELVNQISTNFTSFFRESSHFDFLAERALPEIMTRLRKRGSKDLRFWCAACASGEEAYTIQMVIMKKLGLDYGAFDAGLLATDISTKVLNTAKAGIYTEEQIGGMDAEMKRYCFKQTEPAQFVVKDNIRSQILFRRFNLMNERFPFKTPFQIIFARNVMIYFDDETRKQLVRKFYNHLEPGGYLFIGHSETINPDWTDFKSVLPAIYQKRA